jgi:hypothetical protein
LVGRRASRGAVKTPERDVTDGNARFVASRFVTSRFVHARAPRSGGISMTIDDEWVAVVRASVARLRMRYIFWFVVGFDEGW